MGLINREALLTDWNKKLNRLIPDEDGLHPISLETVIEALGNAQTVDAVEVVRCKDCERSFIYNPKNEGMVYCVIHGMSKNGNGFCEEGVPKDGD